MNSISRSADRIGNVGKVRTTSAFALIVLFVAANAGAALAQVSQGSPAQVTGVTVSQNSGNVVIDVQVQGNAQYQWHRLRDPDNRFWIDFANAQLTTPARDDVEPAPLGGIRLHQINATTVRFALSLTGPKALDVVSLANGVRIVVHPQNTAGDVARNGSGSAGTATLATNANGPSPAQIEAIEHGKSSNAAPSSAFTPPPATIGSNVATEIAGSADDAATPAPGNTTSTSNDTGPTAAQIAAMTGETAPSPTPNPLLTGTSNSPVEWKFAPRGTYVATNPRLIIIDPGHGGSDRGASHAGIQEAVLTLDISKRLRDILISRGWEVMMTRSTDVDVYKPNDSAHDELQARVDVGNTAGARLFVSIHGNSYFNSTPSGTTTYYAKQIDVPLATDVQTELANNLDTKDDGIVKSHFYVTLHSNMPAVLVETAFLSNPGDFTKLTDANWRQKVAQAIADGIADYAGPPPKK